MGRSPQEIGETNCVYGALLHSAYLRAFHLLGYEYALAQTTAQIRADLTLVTTRTLERDAVMGLFDKYTGAIALNAGAAGTDDM